MPSSKTQPDLTDKENPTDQLGPPTTKQLRKPKAKASPLAEFQAKVAATRLAGQRRALAPAPPQSTTPQPKSAQLKSTARPALAESQHVDTPNHHKLQPQALTEDRVKSLPAAAPTGGLLPPPAHAPSQDGSKSSLTYVDLPSDAEDTVATTLKLPPRLLPAVDSPRIDAEAGSNSTTRASATRPSRPAQTNPPPLSEQRPPPRQPRQSTSAAIKPGPAFVRPTTPRKSRLSVKAAASSSGPSPGAVLPDRLPTSATAVGPGHSSRRGSTASQTSGPSINYRSHKALRGQPPPPNEPPPPEELSLDHNELLAAFRQAHTATTLVRERRVDVDEGVEYESSMEDDAAEETKLDDELAHERPRSSPEEPEPIRVNSDDERSDDEEHELGENDLAELLGQTPLASTSARAEVPTANTTSRSLRSDKVANSVTPTLKGSSDAVPSRSTNSAASPAKKRRRDSPSPSSDVAEDSDGLPPHLAAPKKTRTTAARQGKAGTKPRKGLAVIKRRKPTAAADKPVESSAGAMALLPPRKRRGDEGSEVGSTVDDSEYEEEEEADSYETSERARTSRKKGKGATTSPPPRRVARAKRLTNSASASSAMATGKRSYKRRVKTPIPEDDEEDDDEANRKREREREKRRREMAEIDAFELEEVLVAG